MMRVTCFFKLFIGKNTKNIKTVQSDTQLETEKIKNKQVLFLEHQTACIFKSEPSSSWDGVCKLSTA